MLVVPAAAIEVREEVRGSCCGCDEGVDCRLGWRWSGAEATLDGRLAARRVEGDGERGGVERWVLGSVGLAEVARIGVLDCDAAREGVGAA